MLSPARYRKALKFCRLFVTLMAISGCQWFVDDADREVYRLLTNVNHKLSARAMTSP